MYIVHIASELAPVAKVGGLGDVIHGLSKEQQKNGNRVEIIIPKYDVLKYTLIDALSVEISDLWSFQDAFKYHNSVWTGLVDGLKTYFIEPHHNEYYFNRGTIYGTLNDIDRFLYFCRVAAEFLFTSKKKPDIIHVHDWPTAIIPLLLKNLYQDLGIEYGGAVLTIHNLEHQGRCHPRSLTRIGLRGEDFRTKDRLQDPIDPTLINLLQGGIVYADQISTVSPNYAHEITTPQYGFHLDPIIKKHQHKISGILNGIEIETWSPAKNPYLVFHYPSNANEIETVCKQKKENRRELCKKLHGKQFHGPLVACITRLALQKGPELIQHAIPAILALGGSFVLLGSTNDLEMEKEFLSLKKIFDSNPNIYLGLEFNETLAHLFYAAADAILIPSHYEPCGLTQMIAMRYGTVPIGRKTGGLADTIFDLEDSLPNKQNGFLFTSPTASSLDTALKRAFTCFNGSPSIWRTLMQNGISTDFSWKKSALEYQELYNDILKQTALHR